MNKSRGYLLKKSLLSSSIAAALCLGVTADIHADVYKFTFSNGGCTAGVLDSCSPGGDYLDRETDGPDADSDTNESSDAFFTMLTAGGAPLRNSSTPYEFHYYWYGERTPIGGDITIDTDNGTGVASINSFDFYSAGPAVASDVSIVDIGDGGGDPATGNLWLGNMLFDWNGNNGIPLSVVWDMTGLVNSLSGLDVNDFNAVASSISGGPGVGVLPATNNMVTQFGPDFKGDTDLSVGEVLIATTTQNTTPLCTVTTPDVPPSSGGCMTVAVSGGAPVIPDGASNTNTGGTGVGGSPMIDGPFDGFNANFDFKRLKLVGYNDTTAPVLALGSSSTTVAQASSFDPNNPGVSVTCSDNADGSDDITASAATNPDISFTVVSNNVNTATEGVYSVVYTCTDNAVARAFIADDPNNIGSPTVPASNTSAERTLTVTVNNPNRPSIAISGDNPQTHEACTVYNDPGATATDLQDDDATLTAAIDATGGTLQDGDTPTSEGVLTVDYDVTDSGAGNPGSTPFDAFTQTRVVNIVDATAPSISVTGGLAINKETTECAAFSVNLPTATVTDGNGDCSPAIPSVISTTSTVNCTVPDGQDSVQSNLIYTATDTATIPNNASVTAVVTVSRSEPVITLNGGGVTLSLGDVYIEPGIDIHDVQDGDVISATSSGTSSGITYTMTDDIDTSIEGSYTVTYNATDIDGNIAATVERIVRVGVFAQGSNFTMLNPSGVTFGGTNDVVVDWDESLNTDVASTNFNMSIASALPQPFFGFPWTAHHVRVFGPGNYSFDTTCTTTQLEAGVAACGNALVGQQTERYMSMTVADGQVGVHILFDWNGNNNIDVVNVWDRDAVWYDPDGSASAKNNLFDGEAGLPPDVTAPWALVSTDHNGDGINGSPMVDGPFIGFYANFNAGGVSSTEERIPYTGDVDVSIDFTSKPGAGSLGWLVVILSPLALLISVMRRNSK